MKKKLSLLIALAITISVSTTSLAAGATTSDTSTTTNVTNTATTVAASTLTLDEVLNNVESSSVDLQSIDKKLEALNAQYDSDKRQVAAIDASGKSESQYSNGQYAQIMIQKEVTPLQDEQSINDEKIARDEKLNTIKFDLEKQYMNAITAKNQIDNINKNITDLDEQIAQIQAKIDLGQETKDAVNSLFVQKSKLLSQLASPNTQLQQSLLNIKKYLNMSLTSDLKLVDAKKDYVKFDDTDIESKINSALLLDNSLSSLNKSIELQQKQVDIQTKYAYNSLTEPANSQLTLEDLQNNLSNTTTSLSVSLWSAYYALKNKEDTVQAQLVSQESAQMTYDKQKQSYDNGMIDKVTLDSAELALNTQKVSTQQAINDYMITQEKFNYVINGHASLASSIQ
ncbi:TolC family protein [Clostridium sp. PL3]|uniref:TolC family protein n=1 Tax=Clostridium thailandense TaxID=2794346 RepID=A0A949WQE6_9CLOT|nr:TolC family protein [Clostridium thailandense]MBV7272645.1 TolC family protein [Clostridium thailandense]